MHGIAGSKGTKITTFLSPAGAEIVRMYGYWDLLREISPGGYYEEVVTEKGEGSSAPRAGRLARGVYKALVVSPASANTVAKIVVGIADTLVTNAVAQANKGGTPILIVPTDQKMGYVETIIPPRVDRAICLACTPCPPMEVCEYGAITIVDGKPRINLLKCYGCGLCAPVCPYVAIKYAEKVKTKIRRVDVENVKKLKRMRGITVLSHPSEIEKP